MHQIPAILKIVGFLKESTNGYLKEHLKPLTWKDPSSIGYLHLLFNLCFSYVLMQGNQYSFYIMDAQDTWKEMWRTFAGYLTKPINGHVTRGDNNKGQILGIAKVKSSSSIVIKNNCWLKYSHILNLLYVCSLKRKKNVHFSYFYIN